MTPARGLRRKPSRQSGDAFFTNSESVRRMLARIIALCEDAKSNMGRSAPERSRIRHVTCVTGY